MRIASLRGLLTVLAVVTLCTSVDHAADAPATQPAANPDFTHWARFKPGSTRTDTSIGDGPPGMKVVSTFTAKLVAVDKDSVTLEVVSSIKLGDNEPMKSPVDRRTIRSTPDAGTTYAAAGKEEVVLDGKKYACTVLNKTITAGAGKIEMKTWWSDTVPGGLVKVVVADPGRTTTTLTSFEAK